MGFRSRKKREQIMDKTQPHPLFKLATELGPLLVFFAANAKFDLFVATGAFMVAIVVSLITSYVVVLHDETFIKIKPTIIYSMFGLILGGGLVFNRSLIAVMFDQMFNLTPRG